MGAMMMIPANDDEIENTECGGRLWRTETSEM